MTHTTARRIWRICTYCKEESKVESFIQVKVWDAVAKAFMIANAFPLCGKCNRSKLPYLLSQLDQAVIDSTGKLR